MPPTLTPRFWAATRIALATVDINSGCGACAPSAEVGSELCVCQGKQSAVGSANRRDRAVAIECNAAQARKLFHVRCGSHHISTARTHLLPLANAYKVNLPWSVSLSVPLVTCLIEMSLLSPRGVTLTHPCLTAQLSHPGVASLHSSAKDTSLCIYALPTVMHLMACIRMLMV